MNKLTLQILLRLAGCLAATWFVWSVLGLGLFAVIFCAPLLAILMARPLAELLDDSGRWVRHATWNEVDGRHFAHRGYALDVVEDERLRSWLRVSDVRRILRGLPADAVLQRLFPQGFQAGSRAAPSRILAESLLEFLQRAHDRNALKFRAWLRGQVVEPGRRRQQRSPALAGTRPGAVSAAATPGPPQDGPPLP